MQYITLLNITQCSRTVQLYLLHLLPSERIYSVRISVQHNQHSVEVADEIV